MPTSPAGATYVATWLSAETDNGRGILRGLAQLIRPDPHLQILNFSRAVPLTPEMLRARGAQGLVATVDSPADVAEIRRAGILVVNVSSAAAVSGLPTVTTDDEKVGTWAARYFLGRGFQNLAYCGNPNHTGSCIRERAMRREAASAGRRFAHHHIAVRDFASRNPHTMIERLSRWLGELPKPVGVFVFADDVCLQLIEACGESGFRVPEDVAVLGVGVDSTRLAFSVTRVSSIELNATRIGQIAGQVLRSLIAGRAAPKAEILVPPVKIVTRESTDRYAVQDELVSRALDYIRDHAGEAIAVTDVAKAVACARRPLERRFRATLRRSVYEEIQRRRHARAVELMQQPDLSLTEIALAAGYRNGRHLSISFRSRTGTTPTRFRARLLAGKIAHPPMS